MSIKYIQPLTSTNTSTISLSHIVGNEKDIVVLRGKNNRVMISLAPTEDTVLKKLKDLKVVSLPASLHYRDICYCDDINLFVAIAYDSDKVVTSNNCAKWNEVTLPISLKYSSVTYSNKLNKIVIVSEDSNKVLVSDDGAKKFHISTLPSNLNCVDVVAIENNNIAMFVAIADINNKIVRSTDGITWIEDDIPAPRANGKWTSIAYNDIDRKLVAVGSNGSIMMSNTIISNNSPIVFNSIDDIADTSINLSDVCYCRDYDIYCTTIMNSTDVVILKHNESKWTKISMGEHVTTPSNWNKVQYIPFYKMFIMLSGSEDKIAVSFDGLSTWKTIALPSSGAHYNSMCYSSDLKAICITSDNSNKILVIGPKVDNSINWSKINWQIRSLPSSSPGPGIVQFAGICWSPELHMLCAIESTNKGIITSTDGVTWTKRELPITAQCADICWSSELHIFCAIFRGFDNNRILTSSDGITWRERFITSDISFKNICWSPELHRFCVTSLPQSGKNGNMVLTSTDGSDWRIGILPITPNIYVGPICASSKLKMFCILVEQEDITLVSNDCMNWTKGTFPSECKTCRSLCYSPELDKFCTIAIHGTNKSLVSSDGLTWTVGSPLPKNSGWQPMCWIPEMKVFCTATLDNGSIILTSEDGLNWVEREVPAPEKFYKMCWSPELKTIYIITLNSKKVYVGNPVE